MKEDIPFSYSSIVTKNRFIGRDKFISLLQNNIFACQNTIVYGNRKVGKSSLISEAIRQYKEQNKKSKHLFINVELSKCSSTESFISQFCLAIESLIKEINPLKQKFVEISNFIGSIRPIAKINNITGEYEHSIDFVGPKKNILRTIDDTFDLLESIASEYKLTVVLDEFQAIVDWHDSDKLQWQLRSRIQRQDNIGYIFSGSSRKLIGKIFMESKSAFYRSAALIHVENFIDSVLFAKWIKKQFQESKMEITTEATKKILDTTRSHPYYTQKLCFTIWSILRNPMKKNIKIANEEVAQSISELISMEKSVYQERIDRLTPNQKLVLKALVSISPEESLLSKKIMDKYSLPSKSSIQSALFSLENEFNPIVYKNETGFEIEDPFFELWLKN